MLIFITTPKPELKNIKYKITCLLIGFLISNIVSTIPAQTGDWTIIGASLIITINEIISKNAYTSKKKLFIITIFNYIRIGILYGLFVEAFKLGS